MKLNSDLLIRAISFKEHAKLKPCPFCGAKWEGAIAGDSASPKHGLYVYDTAPSSDMQPWAHICCLDCGCGQSSISKWNMRDSKSIIKLTHELEKTELLLKSLKIWNAHYSADFDILSSRISTLKLAISILEN